MHVVAALVFAVTLLSLSACSDSDSDAPASTEQGIDQDIRAARDAGPTLRNIDLYDGPNMYGH